MKIVNYILARLKEASSWAGIAVALGLLGVTPEVTAVLGTQMPIILSGLSALAAVLIPGGRSKTPGA